jgi:hypothetical protein
MEVECRVANCFIEDATQKVLHARVIGAKNIRILKVH